MTSMRNVKLIVNQIYQNKDGSLYKCLYSYENRDALMINVKTRWCFIAHIITSYEDGTIEWDYSTNGEFINQIFN